MTGHLEAALTRLAGPGVAIEGLRRLTGGASLETWAYDEKRDGAVRPLILRRRQSGDEAAFETSLPLATEAALLRLAHQVGVPVAPPIYQCGQEDGLGEAYVVDRVAGETLGRRIVADERFAPARALLGGQCGEALARIHAVPLNTVPTLEWLDAHASLDRYEAIDRKDGWSRPIIEAAIVWLRSTMPEPVAPALVHGDFRNGNLMIDPERGLAAVLDWELAHLGDPAEDFGWLCVNSWRFGRPELPVGGFAAMADLVAGYETAGGVSPPPARIRWWQAMGSLKWAVVTMMMYRTFAGGATRSVERAVIGRRTSECEVDLLALMEA